MPSSIVVMSGASGMIGTALTEKLQRDGYRVRRLVRRPPRGDGEAEWNPAKGTIDSHALDGATAVVHLAGENIGHRWTAARRAAIVTSRVDGTTTIARAIAERSDPPPVMISASAVGIYGDRGDERLDESSPVGSDFLADVCRQWEACAAPARTPRTRVVNIRTGVVLTRQGGALARMRLPFQLGVGGRLGDGNQWMSWITLDDHVRAIAHAIRTPSLDGPVNFTAPDPVTNRDFTRALARALHRWAVFPVPSFVLRLIFGEMADGTLLASQRALPTRLEQSGFVFNAPTIAEGVRAALA